MVAVRAGSVGASLRVYHYNICRFDSSKVLGGGKGRRRRRKRASRRIMSTRTRGGISRVMVHYCCGIGTNWNIK